MRLSGITAVLLGTIPYTSSKLGLSGSAANYALQQRAPTGPKAVIIEMFEWNWDSVAAECTNFIGPAGYGFVQVSPPQEHITGSQWWTDYQPVSYILTSKRGNRAQFQSMVNTCHAAGVGVIVDTIWNHMTGNDNDTGVAGSSYTHYSYPGIYQDDNFHHCGLEPNDDIVNYDNRIEVQTCQLDGLADLGTDTEVVRSRLAQYGNDLLSLGVDGLRLDAAKHIAATDISNITSRLSRTPYITQEVIWGAGEPIQPSEYVGIGDVQEFRYTSALMNAFSSGNISGLQSLDNLGWVSGTQANVFVANHDTERNGNSLNINSPSNTYITATIFSLAHPYGTPTILSSFSFSAYDDGSPNNGAGTCTSAGGSEGWLCQHRYVGISGMVGFRNNVGSAPLTNWVSPQPQQIAFGRGALGFVAINNADTTWSTIFTTSLPSGSYCDVINGISSSGSCTGIGFTVSSGTFAASVPARSAIAIHTGAQGKGAGLALVTFEETATTTWGENIFLTGNLSELGNWAPASAVALSSASYPVWSASIPLPAGTTFQYKFIRKETDGSVIWESDPNRQNTVSLTPIQTLVSSWR
ncbi:glycoside hydrolase family 13 protein [Gymnopilus junonius]|uniref:Alpha-amylase n=1 Tax=Gymnopilus junonius TaxID=109634 RepID=A0A9P5NEL3_GYMJU|nr:glycoside hydrolase family 13 protein [Gymnopilus junonius]